MSLYNIGIVPLLINLVVSSASYATELQLLQSIEQNHQALYEKVAPSVVMISSSQRIGSGFFVDEEGLIITNAHVVDKASKVDVIVHDGSKLQAKVVERPKENIDLVLIKIPDYQSNPLILHNDTIKVGTWVGAVGHGMGGGWTFTTGMVSNIYPDKSGRPVFQTQIPLNPGNSGGPIFDCMGRVIGIATAGIEQANNINFAIRVQVAHKHLKLLEKLGHSLVIKAPDNVFVFVDGKMVGKGPKVVVMAQRRKYEVFAIIDGLMHKTQVDFPEQKEIDLSKITPLESTSKKR